MIFGGNDIIITRSGRGGEAFDKRSEVALGVETTVGVL
jgi:hypothetical protein